MHASERAIVVPRDFRPDPKVRTVLFEEIDPWSRERCGRNCVRLRSLDFVEVSFVKRAGEVEII